MTEGPPRRGLDLGAAAVLLVVATALRLRDFDSIPIHADWAWFLRAAGDLAAGATPQGTYAFLYTSIPVVAFAVLLRLLPVAAALAGWSVLAAAAAPLTYAALRIVSRPPVAFLAAAVVAISPADIRFGRGLESPYLATTCVALGLVGALLGARRRAAGPPLMVLGWTAAAGMHLGLAGLALLGCFLAAMDLGRSDERKGWWVLVASTVLAGCVAPLAVLTLDRLRLASDLLLVMQGAVAGYAQEVVGAVELARQLRGFALTPLAAAAIFVLTVVSLTLAFRRDGPGEGAPVPVLRPALAAVFAAGPYVATFLREGYVSEDHAASLLPLVLAVLVGLGARSRGEGRGGLALALLPVGIWAVGAASIHRPPVAPPVEDKVPWEPLELTLDVARRIADAVPPDREPWVFVERVISWASDHLNRYHPLLCKQLP